MIKINSALRPADLRPKVERLWELSAAKLTGMDFDLGGKVPTFTIEGKYTARTGHESSPGFLYGSALLQFDAFWDETFLKIGRERTLRRMASSVTHFGTHEHGYDIVGTFGILWRLLREGRLPTNVAEQSFYELALKCSGAVQAQRWTHASNGEGFIYSVNGPHSLVAETMRSLRSLALAHQLGQTLLGERDEKTSLLRRLIEHGRTTAKWNTFYGLARDGSDVRGRVAEESIFNVADGAYRGPATQHGYSPYSTCARSLASVMLGYAEQLEFLAERSDADLEKVGGREATEAVFLNAARATSDYYIGQTPSDGIPYWDTGAPGLAHLGNYRERAAEPFNDHEPVDSSAAAIAAQGLLRLGHFLTTRGQFTDAERYWQAGLTTLQTLLSDPYLSSDPGHQGLILHAIHNRPSRADHTPASRRIPCGESTLSGDYHAREVALYLQRVYEEKTYLTFFGS